MDYSSIASVSPDHSQASCRDSISMTQILCIQYCARHNFSYTRGWMQMVFCYHMIYSPETNNYNKTPFLLWLLVIDAQCTMIHTLCINVAWCCGEPVSYVMRHFVPSILLHCLTPTAPLSPSWRAVPFGSLSLQDGFPFPNVHTHPLHTVHYKYI